MSSTSGRARRGGVVPGVAPSARRHVAQRVGHRGGEVGQPVERLRADRAHDPQQLAYRTEVADLTVLAVAMPRSGHVTAGRAGLGGRLGGRLRCRRLRVRVCAPAPLLGSGRSATSASNSRAVSSATDPPTRPAGGPARARVSSAMRGLSHLVVRPVVSLGVHRDRPEVGVVQRPWLACAHKPRKRQYSTFAHCARLVCDGESRPPAVTLMHASGVSIMRKRRQNVCFAACAHKRANAREELHSVVSSDDQTHHARSKR